MSQLLRSMRSSLGGRDLAIKNTLVAKLSSCVKDLLVEQADPDSNDENSSEAVSSLCTTLEAIFIHGLKESFIQRVSQAVMSDLDVRPDPNFWGPLLEVSHRDVIDEVMKLSLVQSDVGRSRAWLRLALNEGVLTRYLEAMRTDGQRTLSHYYRKGALLRDVENLELVQRFLEGIESFPFNLPLNSSLLDVWTVQPLLQAGLWTPPIRASATKDTVAVATDVAQILEKEEQDQLNSDAVSIASFASYNSRVYSPMMAMDEEEALKRILGTPVNETPILAKLRAEENTVERGDFNNESSTSEKGIQPEICQDSKPELTESTSEGNGKMENEDDGSASALGNSIVSRLGWSSSFEETMSHKATNQEMETKEKIGRSRSKKKLESYHSLIESYNTASSSGINPPDLNDFLQQFEPNSISNHFVSLAEEPDVSCKLFGVCFGRSCYVVNYMDGVAVLGNHKLIGSVHGVLQTFYVICIYSNYQYITLPQLSYPQELGFEIIEDTPSTCEPVSVNCFPVSPVIINCMNSVPCIQSYGPGSHFSYYKKIEKVLSVEDTEKTCVSTCCITNL